MCVCVCVGICSESSYVYRNQLLVKITYIFQLSMTKKLRCMCDVSMCACVWEMERERESERERMRHWGVGEGRWGRSTDQLDHKRLVHHPPCQKNTVPCWSTLSDAVPTFVYLWSGVGFSDSVCLFYSNCPLFGQFLARFTLCKTSYRVNVVQLNFPPFLLCIIIIMCACICL